MSTDAAKPDNTIENEFEYVNQIRRVFIIGVSSYIGSALAYDLRDDYEVFGTYLKTPAKIEGVNSLQLDCFDGNEILDQNKKFSPDLIIFCAGFNDKERCQTEVGKAEAINFKAPAIFFKLLPSSLRFIYFSTDEVFGPGLEMEAPFSETDKVGPGSVWARTKFQGESVVSNHKGLTATFRLGRVYGENMGSPLHPRESWLDPISDNLFSNESVDARTNQYRSYTYIGDVVRSVRSYIQKHNRAPTLYNLGSNKSYSEYEFLKLYAKTFKYDPELIKGYEYTVPRPREGVPEPLNCSMTSEKIKEDYGFISQSAEEGLLEFRNRLYEGWTKKWS